MIYPRSFPFWTVRTIGLFAAVLLLLWHRLLGAWCPSLADYVTSKGRPRTGDPQGGVIFAPLPRPSHCSASREKWGGALTGACA